MYRNIFSVSILLLLIPLFAGCASQYFHPVADADLPAGEIRYSLEDWPYNEYWTGIVFLGEKIGFSHLRLEQQQEQFVIHSDASLRLKFLTIDKQLSLKNRAIVNERLELIELESNQIIDGNNLQLKVTADRANDQLIVNSLSNDQTQQEFLPLNGQAVYPTAVMMLMPFIQGIAVGNEYRYNVFNSELRSIREVRQLVLGYEGSDLFEGHAFLVKTTLAGQSSKTWLDQQGLPKLDIAARGVFISALETRQRAQAYLVEAALNRSEALLDYSLIPAQLMIGKSVQEYLLTHPDTAVDIPSDTRQQCERIAATQTRCRVSQFVDVIATSQDRDALRMGLQHSIAVPYHHPLIIDLARQIAGDEYVMDKQEYLRAVLAWIRDNIEREVIDGFSAVDVIQRGKAECQGHAYLLAALLRNKDIPVKLVNGLTWSEQHQGFLYHSWNEVWLDNQWQSVDATLQQFPVDATHIKLLEGEEPADLIPLTQWLGQLEIENLE